MPVQKITIEEFLQLARLHPVLDVRSPGEYGYAHIPGAISLPLFTDEERKVVGTAYKQQSRQTATKLGLDFFGVKMRKMVEEVELLFAGYKPLTNYQTPTANCVLLHCWRGGMRSAGVAWLLDLYGYKVFTLIGGYKSYRKWVLGQFEKPYRFNVIGGYTGSGKTLLLQEFNKQEKPIIDLEAIANHKGSAFGNMGGQPKQEMFENLLAGELFKILQHPFALAGAGVYIEDESQRIGNVQIPMPLWYTIRKSPVIFIDIPFEERLNYINGEYGKIEKEKLVNSIIRIQKRLGGLETKNAINHLLENNTKDCFRILLRYYDKFYEKALHNRENIGNLLTTIPCKSVDTMANTKKINECDLLHTI